MKEKANLNIIKGESKQNISKNELIKISNQRILKKIFHCLHTHLKLEIIKNNKKIQERLNVDIKNYKEYSEKYSSIEIEIIPVENEYGQFINIKKEEENYFHIYFNNNKTEEIKRTYLNKEEKVSKINIIIKYKVKSLYHLFYDCKCIESINFLKLCRSINNMNGMFCGCSSLKELNLSNININNVTDMSCMFDGCSSLKEINLSNFNTNNTTDMSWLFNGCSSLKEINLNNFNINNADDMFGMFSGCLDKLKFKIRNQYKEFKVEAFV